MLNEFTLTELKGVYGADYWEYEYLLQGITSEIGEISKYEHLMNENDIVEVISDGGECFFVYHTILTHLVNEEFKTMELPEYYYVHHLNLSEEDELQLLKERYKGKDLTLIEIVEDFVKFLKEEKYICVISL